MNTTDDDVTAEVSARAKNRMVLTFGLLTALFAAGYGVMFSMLDDYRDTYGISGGSLSIVVAAGFFSSFAAQVAFAPQADRGHARRLVVIGLVFELAGLMLMATGRTAVVLMIARTLMGLGAGMAIPALRRMVILLDPDNLGTNLGRLLTADVAGFALGPAVSAVLVDPFGIAAPFLVIAAATLLCVPVTLRVQVNETAAADVVPATFAFDLLRLKPFVGALCFGAALFVMIGTFDTLWVLVLDDLDASDWLANLGITLFALPLLFLGPIGGRLSQNRGPFRVGTVGLVLGAGFLVAYGQLPSAIAMFVVVMFHAVSDGLTVSSAGVAVGLVAPADRQAGAQGLLGGTQTLAGGVAALATGALYESSGRALAYSFSAGVMVLLVVVGLMLAGPTWRRGSVEGATLAHGNQPADRHP